MDDAEALARAQEDYQLFETNKSDDLARFDRYMAMYKALDNPEQETDKEGEGSDEEDDARYANNKIPLGAAIVDGTVNWLFNFLFPNDRYLRIDADNFEDGIAALKVTGHFQTRHREMKFLTKMEQVLTEAAIADYSITGMRWNLRGGYVPTAERTVELKKLGRMTAKYKKNKVVEKWVPDALDRPDLFRIPYNQCYHDPDAKAGFDDSRAFCYYRMESVEDFLMRAKTKYRPWGVYKEENVEKVMKYVQAELQNAGNSLANADPTESPEANRAYMNHRIKIKVYATADHLFEYFEDIPVWRKNVCGWIFQRWGIFCVPNQFPMMGVLQRIERNEYDINEKLNSRQDYINLVVNPWTILSDKMKGSVSELHQGMVLFDKNPKEAAYVYQPGPNPTDGTLGDVRTQIEFMERVSISPEAQGGHPTGDPTATEVQTVSQGTVGKVKRIARRLEDDCLIPIYNQEFLLEATLMTKEQKVKYFGQFGDMVFSVRPEDYVWNSWPTFIAMGTSEMADEPVRIQQFLAAMDRALQNPQIHNLKNIYAHMWSKFSPKESTSFIEDPRMDSYKIPPDEENRIFATGRIPKVSPLDDHAEHKESHDKYKRTSDYQLWSSRMKMEFEAHIRAHDAASANTAQAMGGPRTNSLTSSTANQLRGVRPTGTGVTP
jgi:hypothetical protein